MTLTPEKLDAMVTAGCTVHDIIDAYAAHLEEKRAQGPRYIHPDLRAAVLNRDNHTCVYCGSTAAPLHCDHMIPYSRGGHTSLDNLAAACMSCNTSKRDRTPEEWRRS
jgi:5-methylcytosine-specific restriction endonuclease McrA